MGREEDSTPTDQPDLTDIRRQRMHKYDQLAEAGAPAYGSRVDGLESTAKVRAIYAEASEDDELSVTIAGRLMAIRKMGKSVFADLQDESGRLQLFVSKRVLEPEQFEFFKNLDIGDIITASGAVFTTRMGEVSLRVENCRLLAKSLRPLPEKFHGLTDVEQRYRQRYLDLITNPEAREVFKQRVSIIRRLRRFLEDKGFLEVETPMLQPMPGGAAAKPFETFYAALDSPMFMRIAPELYLKRLLVGGFERVFELNRNFRNEGLSRRHNPEFTMVEIYQAYGDCRVMMDLVEELVTTIAEDVIGSLTIKHAGDKVINLERPWRRVAYADLVRERMGDDWYDIAPEDRCSRARTENLDIPDGISDVDVTNEVYEKLVEHTLIQPTFVTRLPAPLVPLAKKCEDDPDLVDVFELEINGQEIAPGYSELNDPVEQRKRFEQQIGQGEKASADATGQIDEDFLTALEHGMPPAGGMGIGIDRLVMMLTGAESIRDVILFPQMRSRQ